MTKKLDDRKYRVIQEIIMLEDETLLSVLEEQLEQAKLDDTDLLERVMKPMKKTISIEEMIKEQNYKPIVAKDFFTQAEDLKIEESLEELLSELN